MPPQALAQLQAEALSQLIDRQLVEQTISVKGTHFDPAQIDTAQVKLATQLEAQKQTLDQFLAQRHQTLEGYRRQLAWQLLWEAAMERELTDDVLKAYFEANRKDFDGSEVRVSHILFRPAKSADPNATTALQREAATVREQIDSGKLSFAEAAAKYSTGPSRDRGGDLGFLPRHGMMVEAFSREAFTLAKGKTSEPLVTPFGVHLITVTDFRDGTKTWADVREES